MNTIPLWMGMPQQTTPPDKQHNKNILFQFKEIPGISYKTPTTTKWEKNTHTQTAIT